MRLLKILLTALFAAVAVTMGLVAAAIVGLGAIALLLTRKLVRRAAVSTSPAGHHAPERRPASAAAAPAGQGDVIEVTATEVPADR